MTYVGILPDLFREGQGVVTLGTLQPDGTFRASEVLAKHDETYMPKDVADALKKSGHWNPAVRPAAPGGDLEHDAGEEGRRMIPELGHFALALAVVIAGAQAVLPLLGAQARDIRLMQTAPALAIGQLIALATVVWLPGLERRGGRLLGRQRRGELQQPEAADLQDHRHLGEPRGLHPAVVPDPRAVRRRGRGVRPRAADRRCARASSACWASPPPASCCSR